MDDAPDADADAPGSGTGPGPRARRRTRFVPRPRQLIHQAHHLGALIRGRLWAKVLVGLALGVAFGLFLGPDAGVVTAETAATIGAWVALPGQIFLGLIQMVVIPLVFASIVRGLTASDDPDELKRAGGAALAFFILTTALAIVIGIALALLIQPGQYVDATAAQAALGAELPPGVEDPGPAEAGAGSLDPSAIPEAVSNLVPRNPLKAMLDLEMLPVVLFSVITGLALLSMAADRSRPLLDVLGAVQELSLVIVRWAMWLAPVAVFGLIANLTARLGLQVLLGMGVYVATVLLGLGVLLLVYMVLVVAVARRRPGEVMRACRELQLLAFSTSSSAAVMPITMRTAEEGLGVRASLSQVIVPLAATINMNGTALYQGVATVFLAQVFGIQLGLPALVLIVATAVAASIGSPATPGVGIIILSIVLGAAGVPLAGLALIIGVDRILDMSRTAVNVTGDVVALLVLERWIGGGAPATSQGVTPPAAEPA